MGSVTRNVTGYRIRGGYRRSIESVVLAAARKPGEDELARRRHAEQRRSGEIGLIEVVEKAGIRAL